MQYILGMHSKNKITKEEWEGIAIIDKLGLYPSVCKIDVIKQKIIKGDMILVKIYNDSDEIKKEIQSVSKRFRRDDVWQPHQKYQKSKYILNFYPLKVLSSKFPFKLEKFKEKENIFQLQLKNNS